MKEAVGLRTKDDREAGGPTAQASRSGMEMNLHPL